YDTNDEDGHLEPKLRFPLSELPSRGDALLFLRGEVPDLEARAQRITAAVASRLGRMVRALTKGKNAADENDRIMRFVLQCVFAMFAEDTELVPAGLFTAAMRKAHQTGSLDAVWSLFDDFSRKDPRDKGERSAPFVN